MRNLKAIKSTVLGVAAATAIPAVLAFVMLLTLAPPPASATQAIAKATGQPCTKCHSTPPALNDYGKKYKEGQK